MDPFTKRAIHKIWVAIGLIEKEVKQIEERIGKGTEQASEGDQGPSSETEEDEIQFIQASKLDE